MPYSHKQFHVSVGLRSCGFVIRVGIQAPNSQQLILRAMYPGYMTNLYLWGTYRQAVHLVFISSTLLITRPLLPIPTLFRVSSIAKINLKIKTVVFVDDIYRRRHYSIPQSGRSTMLTSSTKLLIIKYRNTHPNTGIYKAGLVQHKCTKPIMIWYQC